VYLSTGKIEVTALQQTAASRKGSVSASRSAVDFSETLLEQISTGLAAQAKEAMASSAAQARTRHISPQARQVAVVDGAQVIDKEDGEKPAAKDNPLVGSQVLPADSETKSADAIILPVIQTSKQEEAAAPAAIFAHQLASLPAGDVTASTENKTTDGNAIGNTSEKSSTAKDSKDAKDSWISHGTTGVETIGDVASLTASVPLVQASIAHVGSGEAAIAVAGKETSPLMTASRSGISGNAIMQRSSSGGEAVPVTSDDGASAGVTTNEAVLMLGHTPVNRSTQNPKLLAQSQKSTEGLSTAKTDASSAQTIAEESKPDSSGHVASAGTISVAQQPTVSSRAMDAVSTGLVSSGQQLDVSAAHISETRSSVSAVVSQNPYERLDESTTTSATLLHANAQRISVGVHDPSLGWVEVHTQSAAGQVAATLATGSSEAHASLTSQLSSIAQYLTEQDVRVGNLGVEHGLSQGGSGPDAGTAHSGNSSQQQAEYEAPQHVSMNANSATTSVAGLTSDFSSGGLSVSYINVHA